MPPSDRRRATADHEVGASLAKVAARAGVSVATASRVINGIAKKASVQTAEKVRAAVAELGYRPGSVGRALRRQESRIVGVLAANLANPSMAAMASSIEWALRGEGLIMSLCDTHERADVQDEYLREMRVQLARAIILIGAVDSPALDEARTAGATLVFVNRPDPGNLSSPYVGIDNVGAAAEIADRLLERGMRRVSVLHASLDRTAAYWRLKGLLDRLNAAGIDTGSIPRATGPGLDYIAIGYCGMGELMESADFPRVVVCFSDLLAYGAYRRVQEAGLHVPSDIAFFGFDDNSINPWIADWLNSVRVPADCFGPAILETLHRLWRAERPPPLYLEHRLTIRNQRLPGENRPAASSAA
jgi:LacI family transcriptional regulator